MRQRRRDGEDIFGSSVGEKAKGMGRTVCRVIHSRRVDAWTVPDVKEGGAERSDSAGGRTVAGT
jgi:hypothetical protein